MINIICSILFYLIIFWVVSMPVLFYDFIKQTIEIYQYKKNLLNNEENE